MDSLDGRKQVNWGVLGSANIAIHAVIPAIQQSQTGKLAAIASRSQEKARQLADEFGFERAYEGYEALLEDPDVDAVYIPLPNHLHREWTMKAAEAGKHVLCEKPMALHANEAKEMVEACEKAGVKLGEAFMYRHHPRYDQIKNILDSGEIGKIRGIHGSFTFNNAGDAANFRFRSGMGGGSVYDVGCYPINAARHLLGCEPEAVTAHGFFSEEHDSVDMMVSCLIEFPRDVGLTFDCGMWAYGENSLQIKGTEGIIRVPAAFLYRSQAEATFTVTVGGESRIVAVPDVNQYVLQVDEFDRSILNNVPLLFPAEDAVQNMKVIDAVIQSAKERKRVSLGLAN